MLSELAEKLRGRVKIIGIGHPLRGDDGAGPALIRLLEGRVGAELLEVDEVPESYAGKIAAGDPDLILLVDAADFGAEPGAVALLERAALPDRLATTHGAPLALLMDFLAAESGGEVLLLGLQPKQIGVGSGLSAEMTATLSSLADWLAEQSPCPAPAMAEESAGVTADRPQLASHEVAA